MTQHYFSDWYDNGLISDELDNLKKALAVRDIATVTALGEELFESYLDVTAALDITEIKQYAELMGDDLTTIKLEICLGELIDHHQADYIEKACRNSMMLGIGFPFHEHYVAAMTAHYTEFDSQFFEDIIEPGLKQLHQARKISATAFFKIMCEIGNYVEMDSYMADYVYRLLQDPELDLSSLTDEEYTWCLFACFTFYPLNPEVLRLFIKQSKGRKAVKSAEVCPESHDEDPIDYDFCSTLNEYDGYSSVWHKYEEIFIEAFIELKRSGLISDVEEEMISYLEDEELDNLAQVFINA